MTALTRLDIAMGPARIELTVRRAGEPRRSRIREARSLLLDLLPAAGEPPAQTRQTFSWRHTAALIRTHSHPTPAM